MGLAQTSFGPDPALVASEIDDPRDDAELLRAARGGEQDALHVLITRHVDWLRDRVRRRLQPQMRRELDSDDFLQNVLLGVLKSPAVREARDVDHLRALLVHVIEKDLLDQVRWATRKRRDRGREQSLHADSSWVGGKPEHSVTRPSESAHRNERVEWIRAAMERLTQSDREVLELRVWKGMDYPAIAEHVGLQPDAARMRTQRALQRLAKTVEAMRGS